MNPLRILSLLMLFSAAAFPVTVTLGKVTTVVSLLGMDVDADVEGVGEGLSATLVERPMALSGAFPEVLVWAIAAPYQLGSAGHFQEKESNQLVLSSISLGAVLEGKELAVTIDVSQLKINPDAELSPRHLVDLTILAIRRNLEGWEDLEVSISVEGAREGMEYLTAMGTRFSVGE